MLHAFATVGRPLRSSKLPDLMRCPLKEVLMFLGESDSSGPAADTGSAVHHAVANAHRGVSPADAMAAMRAAGGEFPLADFGEADLHFRPYAKDPRNQEAKVVLLEQRVDFKIKAAASDPTGEAVIVRGTLDQVRAEGGRLYVWDVKTSLKEGYDLLQEHAYQLAGYVVGAEQTLGKEVWPGGIIRTRGYRKRGVTSASPPGVFWHAAWGRDEAHLMMREVAEMVARVRRGEFWPSPGPQCQWCPAREVTQCVPRLVKLRMA